MNLFLRSNNNDHAARMELEKDDDDEHENRFLPWRDLGDGPLSHLLSFLTARELSQVEQTNRFLHHLSTTIAWPALHQLLLGPAKDDDKVDASIQIMTQTSTSTLLSQHKQCRERVIRFTVAADHASHMEHLARQHYDYDNPYRGHVTCSWASSHHHHHHALRDRKNYTVLPCPFPHKLHAKALYHPEQYDFFVRLSYRQAPPGWNQRSTTTTSTTTTSSLLIWQGFCPAHKQWSPGRLYLDLEGASLTPSSWQTMQAFLDVLHDCQTQQSRNYINAYRFQDSREAMDEDDALNAFFSIDHPDVLALLYEALDNLSVTVVAVEKPSSSSSFGRPHLLLATGGFHDRVTETTAPMLTYHDRQEIRTPSTATNNTLSTRNTNTTSASSGTPRMMTAANEEDEPMPDVDIRTTTSANVNTNTTTFHSNRERLAFSLHPRNVCTHGMRQEEDWMSVELYTDGIRSGNQDGGVGSKGSRWKGSDGSDTRFFGKFRGLSVSHEW